MIVNWMGRDDSAQHQSGAGSPEGLAALRLMDAQIGLPLARLWELERGFADLHAAQDLACGIENTSLIDSGGPHARGFHCRRSGPENPPVPERERSMAESGGISFPAGVPDGVPEFRQG